MRGVLIVACTLAALTLAPAAHADVTIGSDLAAAPNANIGPDGPPSQRARSPGARWPHRSPGSSRRWGVRGGDAAPPVRLVVIRRPEGIGDHPGGGDSALGAVRSPAGPGRHDRRAIAIAAGDYIGLECCEGDGRVPSGRRSRDDDIWDPPSDDAFRRRQIRRRRRTTSCSSTPSSSPTVDGDGVATRADETTRRQPLDGRTTVPTRNPGQTTPTVTARRRASRRRPRRRRLPERGRRLPHRRRNSERLPGAAGDPDSPARQHSRDRSLRDPARRHHRSGRRS